VAIGALLAPGEEERAARALPQLDPHKRRRRGGTRERAQSHASRTRTRGRGGDSHGSRPTPGGAERGHLRNCAQGRRLRASSWEGGVSKSRKQSTRDQKILRYFLYKIDLTGHDSLYLLHEGNSSVRILCCFVEIENSHGFRIPKIKLPQILLLSAPYLGRRGPRTNRCPIQ
jgi:hypothetical protein